MWIFITIAVTYFLINTFIVVSFNDRMHANIEEKIILFLFGLPKMLENGINCFGFFLLMLFPVAIILVGAVFGLF